MNKDVLTRVLGRNEWNIPLEEAFSVLAGKRILVTGGNGSIGQALHEKIRENVACSVEMTDTKTLDVRSKWKAELKIDSVRPDFIFHLAGAKHAPAGELDPAAVVETNITGTINVVNAAKNVGAKVILASTCKACDPETAYGASKLIAERIVLGSGGSVARFYNVVETSGNVFEIWDAVRHPNHLLVTGCTRYFITLQEAVSLLLWTITLPVGRYAVNPGTRRAMWDVAAAYLPHNDKSWTSARRGDRKNEKLLGTSETITKLHVDNNWLLKITSPHEEST